MRELPKSFGIKYDENNPLWKKYIDWLSLKYRVFWNGNSNAFYGVRHDGRPDCLEGSQKFDTILTLEEWDSIVNGWKPKRGEMVEVSNDGEYWSEREFATYVEGIEYPYAAISHNGKSIISWELCRPITKNLIHDQIKKLENELAELKKMV